MNTTNTEHNQYLIITSCGFAETQQVTQNVWFSYNLHDSPLNALKTLKDDFLQCFFNRYDKSEFCDDIFKEFIRYEMCLACRDSDDDGSINCHRSWDYMDTIFDPCASLEMIFEL